MYKISLSFSLFVKKIEQYFLKDFSEIQHFIVSNLKMTN